MVEKWNLSRSLFSLPLSSCLSHFSLFLLCSLTKFFTPSPSLHLALFFSLGLHCYHATLNEKGELFHPFLDDYHFIFQLPIIPLLPYLPLSILFILPLVSLLNFSSLHSSFLVCGLSSPHVFT